MLSDIFRTQTPLLLYGLNHWNLIVQLDLSPNLVYTIDEELMEHDLTKELICHMNPNQRRNLYGWAPS